MHSIGCYFNLTKYHSSKGKGISYVPIGNVKPKLAFPKVILHIQCHNNKSIVLLIE